MSTYITVTSDTSRLVNRVKQVQQTNREAQLQRERDTTLQAKVEAELADTSSDTDVSRGGNPDTSIDRRPAAHRNGGTPGVFPVWITGGWRDSPLGYDSFEGFIRGIDIYPIYNPANSIRLEAAEPLIPWPGYSVEHTYIFREHYWVLPIDGQSAIIVYLLQFKVAISSRQYDDFSTGVTITDASTLKCAVAGLYSAREIGVPDALRARVSYLCPDLPQPSHPWQVPVYSLDSFGQRVFLGWKYPIQWWYDTSYSGYFPGWDYAYDPAQLWTMQTMNAYGIGSLKYEGFSLRSQAWIGQSANSIHSAGVYDTLLRYQKQMSQPGATGGTHPGRYWDNSYWHPYYDFPISTQYLSLNKFKGGWIDAVHDANSTIPPSDILTFRGNKKTKVDSINTSVDVSSWDEFRPKVLEEDYLYPTQRPGNYDYVYNSLPNSGDAPNLAYDWGNPSYCKSQLRQLGFKDADMKP